MSMTTDSQDIIVKIQNGFGHLRLNRPKALNALSYDMLMAMDRALGEWMNDDGVHGVIVSAEGEKAFCAGGDIRKLYEMGKAGEFEGLRRFYRDEYILNSKIFHYRKPYIALMDGIVMGGGAGVSVLGRHRIVTESTLFAMPETGIGFFPDVGGSYFLPRCPGHIGMYLALTGERLGPADMLYCGLADYFVPRGRLENLTALVEQEQPRDPFTLGQIIRRVSEDAGASAVAALRPRIDHHFRHDSVEAILDSLENAHLYWESFDWERRMIALLRARSPIALKATFHLMRQGRALGFQDCLKMEWALAARFSQLPDLYEGIRAVIIDKDRNPKWTHERLEDVGDDAVTALFAPLAQESLSFA